MRVFFTAIVAMILVSGDAFGQNATHIWDPQGPSGKFSNGNDWKLPGGQRAGTPPGASSFAVFDGTNDKDCVIEKSHIVHSLEIDAGYSGTIDFRDPTQGQVTELKLTDHSRFEGANIRFEHDSRIVVDDNVKLILDAITLLDGNDMGESGYGEIFVDGLLIVRSAPLAQGQANHIEANIKLDGGSMEVQKGGNLDMGSAEIIVLGKQDSLTLAASDHDDPIGNISALRAGKVSMGLDTGFFYIWIKGGSGIATIDADIYMLGGKLNVNHRYAPPGQVGLVGGETILTQGFYAFDTDVTFANGDITLASGTEGKLVWNSKLEIDADSMTFTGDLVLEASPLFNQKVLLTFSENGNLVRTGKQQLLLEGNLTITDADVFAAQDFDPAVPGGMTNDKLIVTGDMTITGATTFYYLGIGHRDPTADTAVFIQVQGNLWGDFGTYAWPFPIPLSMTHVYDFENISSGGLTYDLWTKVPD